MNSPSKTSHLLLITVLLALGSAFLTLPAAAVEQRSGSAFDHAATRFPLLGAHAQTDCQTCHLQGIFKGTPRQCEFCHMKGSRIATTSKPANHPVTSLPCAQCHSSQTTWTGARFDHVGVIPGTCATCHNGMNAAGKPNGHVVTTQSCDKCHRTTAWVPAGFDHTGVAPGTCETCHITGGSGTPRPGGTHPATGSCDGCHSTLNWIPRSADHSTFIAGQCNTCHGVNPTATAKPAGNGHIPTALSCDACHNRAPAHFTSNIFTHLSTQGVSSGSCNNCHNGTYSALNVLGKNDTSGYTHIPTAVTCDTCHNTTNFRGGTFNHAAQGITMPNTTYNCYQCHDDNHGRTNSVVKGPDHRFVQHVALGNCADSGCHTSTSSWNSHGNNENYRLRLKKK